MSLPSTIETLRARIHNARKNSALSTDAVTLLAASKGQPEAIIDEAIRSGILDFGENRVQEMESKWPGLKSRYPQVRLHLIGPLQTNKVKEAVEGFDVIQTLDRVKLADALAEAMGKAGRMLPCYIQVNTGKEPQKAGVFPEEADSLIEYCRSQLKLNLAGLMCIPPTHQPPAPHFAYLRSLALSHGLAGLSMGMSDDFETAVRLGANCVRLGRALFGERPE